MSLKRISPTLSDDTLFTTVKRNYRDLDLSFTSKPGAYFEEDNTYRGDIYKKSDTKAVIQSCHNILLTNKGEKPFDPDFGGDLRRLLFELNTSISELEVTRTIRNSLEQYEPRVEVVDVVLYYAGEDKPVPRGVDNIFQFYKPGGATSEDYTLTVSVTVRILNTGQVVSTSLNMNRLR